MQTKRTLTIWIDTELYNRLAIAARYMDTGKSQVAEKWIERGFNHWYSRMLEYDLVVKAQDIDARLTELENGDTQ